MACLEFEICRNELKTEYEAIKNFLNSYKLD
jgi:hypothetical protein